MKVLLSLMVMYFLGMVACEHVPLFNLTQYKKEKLITRIRRGLDWSNDCSENSAEFNFYEMAFGLIARLLGGRYTSLDTKFGDVVYSTAYNQFGPGKHSDYDWVCQFPGAVRGIRWNEVNNNWNGRRDGFDAMLNSLPGLLSSAIYSGNQVEERELRTLLHFGEIAVRHREDLDRSSGGDDGHRQSTNLLRQCYESLKRFIEDMFGGTSNSQHNELRRRGFSADVHYGGESFRVKFYQHNQFGGELLESRYTYASSNGQCYNLPNGAWDRTSSVNTGGGCVVLYRMQDCRSRYIVLFPGSDAHNNLAKKGFNDETRSYRSC